VDVLVEELNLTTLKRGRPIEFNKLEITVDYNQVGVIVLELPANDRAWELVQLDGNGDLIPVGVVVTWGEVYTWSGYLEGWVYRRALADGQITETLTLTGPDWLSLLANRIAYPNPAAAWSAQTVTSTTYGPDPAETVIKDIVAANLVTAGDTNRRVPLLTVATDQGRGGSATYKVVPPNPAAETDTEITTVAQSLIDMVRAVNAQSPMGARIELGDGELVFDVYVPRDLTETAVFSPTLGNLPEATLTAAAPLTNAVLLQSKVSGSNFVQANGNGYNSPWRRVEQFSDQSSTDTAADITTAGNEAVAAGASTVKIAATAVDLPLLRFGADAGQIKGYREGDTVAADLRDGIVYPDVVSRVQLVADRTSDEITTTVTPTIGTPDEASGQGLSAKVSARLRAIEKALRGSV
jgi:hypothetical protein